MKKPNRVTPEGADFINVLYSEFLVYDPADPKWINRDRFFLDPGHMSPMLYSVLAMSGFYTMDDLKSFRQWGSITPGHHEVYVMHGIENTSTYDGCRRCYRRAFYGCSFRRMV